MTVTMGALNWQNTSTKLRSRQAATRMSPRELGILLGVAVSMVPGARHGPNVCRFVSSGWPRHESEANLSGLDLGTFRRRPALGGCRVVRLAGLRIGTS